MHGNGGWFAEATVFPPWTVVLPSFRYRPIGVLDPRPIRGQELSADASFASIRGGDRMRAKFSGWKHLLYSAAVLATLALAAGARYKP